MPSCPPSRIQTVKGLLFRLPSCTPQRARDRTAILQVTQRETSPSDTPPSLGPLMSPGSQEPVVWLTRNLAATR